MSGMSGISEGDIAMGATEHNHGRHQDAYFAERAGGVKWCVDECIDPRPPPKNNTIDWICSLFTSRKFNDGRRRAEDLWNQFVMIGVEFHKMRRERRKKTNSRFFALSGFGCLVERRAVLKVLSKCLKPQLLHCAQVSNNTSTFEMIVGLNMEMDDVIVNMLEEGFEMFCMSLNMTTFDRYMEPAMVTGMQRIMNGIMQLGNLFCKKNHVVVRDLEAVLAQRQREEDMQRVRSVTGLNFTTGNMLALHHELVNLQIDNSAGSGSMRQEIRDTVQEINWLRLRITEEYEQREQVRNRNEFIPNETSDLNAQRSRRADISEVNSYFMLLDSLFHAANRLNAHVSLITSPENRNQPTNVSTVASSFVSWRSSSNISNQVNVPSVENHSVVRPVLLTTHSPFLNSDMIMMLQDPTNTLSRGDSQME